MSELLHYENPGHWDAAHYVEAPNEVLRFETCMRMVPADASGLLDVGTGNGAFLRFLERSRPGLKLSGLERARAALDRAVCTTPIVEGSCDRLPFEDRSVDVVAALEVIEHLPYGVFERALREMERVSARYVLVSVPYREMRVQVRCPKCACVFNPHYHVRRFDDEVLRGLFRDFECVALEPIEVSDVALGGIVKPLFRWLRARAGFFPTSAVCPQCAYCTASAGGGGEEAAAAPRVAGSTRRALRVGLAGRRLLPKVRRAQWAAALYRRRDAR